MFKHRCSSFYYNSEIVTSDFYRWWELKTKALEKVKLYPTTPFWKEREDEVFVDLAFYATEAAYYKLLNVYERERTLTSDLD